MSSFTHPIAVSAPIVRSVAIAALMGATMLATPFAAARAEQSIVPQSQAAAGATETKGETVEQRITNLHAALKITPEQGTQWNAVAQAMRENAANMDKIVAADRTTPPQNMSAVEDLKSYQKFAQAHVDGLKNLISSFEKLYAAMQIGRASCRERV
jgi:periplasmic protein CpxP/Spy